MRVISVDTPSATSTVSVFVKAGSRYENRHTSGASHFLRKLAYRGTAQKSGLRTVRDLEHFGTQYFTNTGKEFVEFHTKTARTGSPSLDIAVESLNYQLSPLLQEWEVNEVRDLVKDDLAHSDNFTALVEAAHFEGFRDSGLANPTECPTWNVDNIDNRALHHHVSHNYFGGDRITVVGTGVDHHQFVDLVKPIFSNPALKGSFREIRQQPALNITEKTSQSSKWVGGSVVRLAGSGEARVLVAYPGAAADSQDVHTFSVLQEVLNAHLHNGSAFHVSYSDAGFFGIYSEGADGAQVSAQLQNLLKAAAGSLNEESLSAAKKSAKIRYLSGLEDPLKTAQLLISRGAKAIDADAALKQIDSVSASDIQRVAADLQKAGSVVVAGGDVRGVSRV